jgi:TonB family protein
LLITVGILAGQRAKDVPRVSSVLVTEISPYILPDAADRAGGGGGGGDHSILQASKGNPPRFAREQLTPPAIAVQNEAAKLTAEPTVVGPPELSFPQTQMGDPLAGVLGPASSGTGRGGGIGSGAEGGVGAGRGAGVGPGFGGGIGGGPYRVGHGVSAPRAIYDPEPDYSDEARRAKYQGMVVLRVVVGSDGRPQDVRVARTLGMGLDEKAMEAVRQWRFEPGYRDGRAVPVVVDVQVNFRLY